MIRTFCLSAVLTVIFAIGARTDCPVTLEGYVGGVKLERAGKVIPINTGVAINENDSFHIDALAFIMIRVCDKGVIRVHGPSKYIFHMKYIQTEIARSNLQSKLLDKSSSMIPNCSKTTVIAVRGLRGTRGSAKIPDDLKKEIDQAASLFNGGQYDRAYNGLLKIKAHGELPDSAKPNIDFYLAEIHFRKNDFAKALTLYLPLTELERGRFLQHEHALVRSILCCDFTGKNAQVKTLAEKYLKLYGENGQYYDIIKAIGTR